MTEDFLSSVVRQAVSHVVPVDDTMRYRFGDQEIVWRSVGGDPNRLEVEVRENF